MKKILLGLTAFIAVNAMAAEPVDSLKMEQLHEVVVSGVRTQKNAPYAVANIKQKELSAFSTSGRELPFLFARTPGVMAWSENGMGTGTTKLAIRGAGDSRINVTLDGVPLNSPEDQCVFWANMNSYASLLGSAQIQRGVGTSTNGDGAFGGTVALQSKAPSMKAGAEWNSSFGSYNTYNIGGKFTTGLMLNHLVVDVAYHTTGTDGYVHGTDGRSGSYYGGLTWLNDRMQISYKHFGNFEKTGQAWNGVTPGDGDLSLMDGTWGANTGIKDYADLNKAGLGRYNDLYEHMVNEGSAFARDADGRYITERYQLNDGSLWKGATDNFWQGHNILTGVFRLSDRWAATLTAHYTHGHGYYQDLKYDKKLAKYGLEPFYDAQGNQVKTNTFIRKKGMSQDAYGALGNVNYKDQRWNIIGGFSLQQFKGDHYSRLIYAENKELHDARIGRDGYDINFSEATKNDANVYLKAAYEFAKNWNVFADAQYRYVGYKTDGTNDAFYTNGAGQLEAQRLDVDETYNFFNPKAGVSYSKGPHHAYASVAMSHREPERNNFTDNYNYPFPKAERVIDYELGYNYSSRRFRGGVNFYYMDYTDQFVKTGAMSDIGEALTTNIKDSYRMGVELSAAWDICPLLTIEGNAALSQNKIKNFDEVVSVDWSSTETFHYDNSTLACSPSAVLNGFVDFHYKGFNATWHTNYVSRQYLDNTECRDRSLPAYTFSNLYLSYTSKVEKVAPLKEVELGLTFNNVFNAHYATAAYVYSCIASGDHPNNNRYYQIYFFPMANSTAMANLTLRF